MKFAAVFPGQGSQHVGMGRELFDNFNQAKHTYEEASDALKIDLKKLCFDGPESELKLTANTQPALLVTSIAAWRTFISETAVRPEVALGHSLGEYSALVASGAMSLTDAIVTVRVRGLAMQEAVPIGVGGMCAVMGLSDSVVARACADMQDKAISEGGLKGVVLEAANYNCPGQVVVSGHLKAIDFMKTHLNAAEYGGTRVKFIPLVVSAPFHCSLMKPAAERLRSQLEKVSWKPMAFDVVHNVDSKANRDQTRVKDVLYGQMTRPVLWTQSVEKVGESGCTQFVEFGAGRILSGLVKKILPDSQTLNVDVLDNLKLSLKDLEQNGV